MRTMKRFMHSPVTIAFAACVLLLTLPSLILAGESSLDVNAATVKQLEALPGIGKEIAKRIVEYREAKGPFKSLDDLQHVKGIGKAKLAKIQDRLTVGISAKSSESH